MKSLTVIVMAAGKGTRMESDMPKVLAPTSSGTLLSLVLAEAARLSPKKVVVVTGYGKEAVQKETKQVLSSNGLKRDDYTCVVQEKQLGTGDAVQAALSELTDYTGPVLILSGDMPLITTESLSSLLRAHDKAKATISFLSARMLNPAHYGRVLRDEKNGEVLKIIEARDATPAELLIQEINTGVYIVDSAFLAPAIKELKNNNSQTEYYLTDIVERAVSEGQTVIATPLSDPDEAFGVNTSSELSYVNEVLERKAMNKLIAKGVCITRPSTCSIHPETIIGKNVSIGPNTVILEGCYLTDGVTIEGACYLKNVSVGKNSILRFGIRAEDCSIGEDCTVGPFAHIRPKSRLDRGVKIGNFVETKNAHLHQGAKASHLSYLGDCEIGKDSNIGAGTIFCNYDGKNKHHTSLGEGVFVGSNSALVAPVKIGDGAFIGAGSVITKEVSKGSLALTRAEQKEVKGWRKR